MGNCKPSCLFHKTPTIALDVDIVEDRKGVDENFENLGRGKTMVMRTCTVKEGDEYIEKPYSKEVKCLKIN
jgi:hypothetical protein